MNPIISIIVPVYKVEPYLCCCLDSVLAQTFTDFECILVDDGSPDNCPAICDEYAKKYPQMRVIHKANGGLSDARNVGIYAAIGEFIVLLDSDDRFAAEYALKSLYTVIMKTKAMVIFNSNLTIFTDNYNISYDGLRIKQNQYSSVKFYKKARSKNRIMLAGCLFTVQRNFLLRNNLLFEKEILHEDEHWFPRVIASADMIGINHGLFYAYRKGRNGSITSVKNPKRIFDVIFIMNTFIQTTKEKTYPHTKRKIFFWHAAQIWVGVYLQLPDFFNRNQKQYKEILEVLNKRKNILFKGRNVKYILFGVLLCLIGLNGFYFIKNIFSIEKRKN